MRKVSREVRQLSCTIKHNAELQSDTIKGRNYARFDEL